MWFLPFQESFMLPLFRAYSQGTKLWKACEAALSDVWREFLWLWRGFYFPESSVDGKESACNVGDLGLIPGLGRSSGERNGCSLQYSCLENPIDRRAWRATVQEITKSWTQLRTNTFTSFLILQNSAPLHPKFFSLAPRNSTTDPVMGHFGDFHGMPRLWMTLE